MHRFGYFNFTGFQQNLHEHVHEYPRESRQSRIFELFCIFPSRVPQKQQNTWFLITTLYGYR